MINDLDRRSVNTAYRLSVVTMAMMGADVAAQNESFSERDTIRIEVTGSNIRRTDTDGLLPLQIITRDEIKRAGWTTAAELMSHVAANFNGQNDRESIGQAQVPGFAGANLRGIGEGYTLVLLNGRRLANYAFLGNAVDLSAVPFAAIERVEILRDGASSIYGSDAIAGVVNFVLRKDYRGFEVSGHAESPEHRGAGQSQATATIGFGDLIKDRYNAFINVDWQKMRALAEHERGFSRTGYRPEQGLFSLGFGTFPGGIEIWHGDQFEGTLFLGGVGCAPPLSRLIPEFDGDVLIRLREHLRHRPAHRNGKRAGAGDGAGRSGSPTVCRIFVCAAGPPVQDRTDGGVPVQFERPDTHPLPRRRALLPDRIRRGERTQRRSRRAIPDDGAGSAHQRDSHASAAAAARRRGPNRRLGLQHRLRSQRR